MSKARLGRVAGGLMVAGALMAFAGVFTASPELSAAGFEVGGKALKTRPIESGKLDAFHKAVADLEKAPKESRGPKHQAVRAAAAHVKGDVAGLVKALKSHDEVKAFDAHALAKAKAAGGDAEKELVAAGGAYALLSQADKHIDKALERMAAEAPQTALPGGHESSPATLGQTACGVFWWTISLGYATDFAYKSCYAN